jgi:hypothetical protein
MVTKRRDIVTVFSALLYLMLSTGTIGKVVICYKANGQAAVEASEDGIHCSHCTLGTGDASPNHGYNWLSVFSGASCDPCKDLPLTFSSLAGAPDSSQPAPSQLMPLLTIPRNDNGQIASHPENYFIQLHTPAPDVMLSSLTSVILQI